MFSIGNVKILNWVHGFNIHFILCCFFKFSINMLIVMSFPQVVVRQHATLEYKILVNRTIQKVIRPNYVTY